MTLSEFVFGNLDEAREQLRVWERIHQTVPDSRAVTDIVAHRRRVVAQLELERIYETR